MKKYIPFIILILIGCSNDKNLNSTQPQIQDITESVYASLKVQPRSSYYAQSAITGIIEKVYITEGARVAKGDILFKVKAPTAQNRLDDAQISLQQSKANYMGQNSLLKNILIEIDMAQQRLQLDSIQYVKLNNLWNKNIGSKNDVDNALLKYKTARNNMSLLRKKYKQTQFDLENTYEKALNKLDNERKNLSDFTIQSLMEGVVYEVNKEAGEWVSAQDRLAEIGSSDNFLIEMEIDELDIAMVHIGDTAIVSLDAFPDEIFMAVVTNIFPKKDMQNLTYKIQSDFVDKPKRLLYGLSGEANIIIDKRKRALTIPTEYLKSDNTILTKEGEINIKTGMKNMKFVEILSGIDTSTILIKPE